MKKIYLTLGAAWLFAIGSTTMISCGNAEQGVGAETHESGAEDADDLAATYQCPMKCEGDKTYTKAGKCPECKMNLKAAEKEVKAIQSEEVVYYMLPSALQIAHIYRKSGLKYYPNITSETKNMNKYFSETSKLQNLGIYSADLCYVALNKQTQEQLHYLKAMMDMSADLGFSSIFSGAFVDRFERNMANEDSMIMILSELQERLDYYLKDAELEDKSTIIFSGAWIESVHISLSGFKIDGEGSGVSVRIHEQLNILSSLIGKLKQVWEPDEEIASLIEDLTALRNTIENFDFMKDVDKKSHVLLKDVSLSEEELAKLAEEIKEIRTKIIKG